MNWLEKVVMQLMIATNSSKTYSGRWADEMKNVLVARIDDRLIHGQVVTAWVKTFPITEILIIADDLAKNMLMQRIYKSVAPHGVEVNVMDGNNALSYLRQIGKKGEHIMILVKTPDVFEHLVENGIPFNKIVLGGMGLSAGRQVLIRNVSANESERESLKRLISKGIKIVYQMVPVEKEVEIEKYLSK
ncbi:MAG: PTS sugar transporter subunit IIB [Anaerolineaceae bacterium]|nr:PTS sugar transporter subunit IIB [Anaerolineaceae bacterium]